MITRMTSIHDNFWWLVYSVCLFHPVMNFMGVETTSYSFCNLQCLAQHLPHRKHRINISLWHLRFFIISFISFIVFISYFSPCTPPVLYIIASCSHAGMLSLPFFFFANLLYTHLCFTTLTSHILHATSSVCSLYTDFLLFFKLELIMFIFHSRFHLFKTHFLA